MWEVILLCHMLSSVTTATPPRPHVVFIMSDDMGWNDVSYHGSDQVLTPNIDALAYAGTALHRYYFYPTCTPSRAALLTGKYAHRIGMQGYPLTNSEDRGIPESETLLPAYLKGLGYHTRLVGKWHVGASRDAFLPTERGYDDHFGFRAGTVDYYEYVAAETWGDQLVSGFDLYRNKTPAWDVQGYLTDLLTQEAVRIISSHNESAPLFLHLAHAAPHSGPDGAPLQAPPAAVRANGHVRLPERRILAGMMSKLDESIGAVIKALSDREMLNDTIIIFANDNGGMTAGPGQNWASNWPLRGEKFAPYEGGIRVPAIIWSSKMPKADVWSGMMHVTDWLPTILSAVGGEIPEDIDGVDQWKNILAMSESKRNSIVDINDFDNYSSAVLGDYKLILGDVNDDYSKHLSGNMLETIGNVPNYIDTLKESATFKSLSNIGHLLNIDTIQSKRDSMRITCDELEDFCYPSKDKPCLFNIRSDPCEYQDISAQHPEIVAQMTQLIEEETHKRIPRTALYRDPLSDPLLHNNTWAPWIGRDSSLAKSTGVLYAEPSM